MTQEEKAKAYDEAIEKLRNFYRDYDTVSCLIDVKEELANLFPELKESEDERIREWIKKELENNYVDDGIINNILAAKALAWLEKQKPSDAALEYLKENHSPSEVSDFQAAMNIAVAKAYDQGRADAIKQDPCRTCDHPTMSCINFPCEKKQAKQKPAEWSEEDSYMLAQAIKCVNNSGKLDVSTEEVEDWLKSLKPQPKQEWSEEDDVIMLQIIDCLQDNAKEDIFYSATEWLKSLRPKTHWKPSDEQMRYLKKVYESYYLCDPERGALESLYNGLQKLL